MNMAVVDYCKDATDGGGLWLSTFMLAVQLLMTSFAGLRTIAGAAKEQAFILRDIGS
jgi:hypothetical protein